MSEKKRHDPTALGWLVRLVSLGLMAALVATIVLQMGKPPADIRFETRVVKQDIRRDRDQWLVPVEVTNRGTGTARVARLELIAEPLRTPIEIAMIGHNETVTYMLASDRPLETVDHRIVSYEAP